MRKLLFLLLMCATMFNLFIVNTYASEGDFKYKINEDGTVKVTDYIGEENDVVVPLYIDGKKVVSIGYGAFSYNNKIKSVVLPETINSIGYGAFQFSINLERVDIYGDITKIGDKVFYDCRDLKEVNFYGSLCHLGAKSFYDCENLESVTLPDGVEYIGSDCFMYCTKLEYVVLPDGLKNIGSRAFSYCSSLVVIDIPESYEENGFAFRNCPNLISVSIPDTFKIREDISEDFYDLFYYKKYTNINREVAPINSSNLHGAALNYMSNLGYKTQDIEIRDTVENPLGIRVYYKTSPEEMYYICVNQDADGNPDIIYTRKIDIFEYEKGDVNRDLKIDANDALEILKYSADLVDLSYANMRLGDFDDNGNASVRDALVLLKYVVKLTDKL